MLGENGILQTIHAPFLKKSPSGVVEPAAVLSSNVCVIVKLHLIDEKIFVANGLPSFVTSG